VFADVGGIDLDAVSGYYTVLGRVFHGASVIRIRRAGDNVTINSVDIGSLSDDAFFVGMASYRTD